MINKLLEKKKMERSMTLNEIDEIGKNYNLRDYLKPTVVEWSLMALALPTTTLPFGIYAISEAVQERYDMAVPFGVASVTPQVLVYLAGRGMELLANLRSEGRCSRRSALKMDKGLSFKILRRSICRSHARED